MILSLIGELVWDVALLRRGLLFFGACPLMGVMKFNVDGALRDKPGPKGNKGVLHSRGEVLLMFSQHIGVRDSNEAKVLVIPEGLKLFSRRFIGSLVIRKRLF